MERGARGTDGTARAVSVEDEAYAQELREAALERAVQKVRDVLSVPEGLKRIDALCAQTERVKSGVDTQLRATADAHLGAARKSIAAVSGARSTLEDVQQSYAQLDRLCAECSGLLADSDYAVIQRLQRVRENVRATLVQVQAVQEIPGKVAALHKELECEGRNLDAIYRQLVGLEEFAENAAAQGRKHEEMLDVLREPIELVQRLCKKYEQQLANTFKKVVALAGSAPWTLVRANQAVERQHALEQEKQRQKKLQQQQQQEQQGSSNEQKQQQQEQAVVGKGWRELRARALQDAIDERFATVLGSVPDEVVAAPQQFIGLCDMLLDDLAIVFDKAAPCFPPEVRVFESFVVGYHKHFCAEFQSFGQSKHRSVPNSAIVAILKWVFKDYPASLARLGVGALEPPIERSLLTLEQLYTTNVQNKMYDWVPEVVKGSRAKEPVLVEGQLFTTAPDDLFSIMNAQLDVARSTCSRVLCMRISSAISGGIISFCHCLADEVADERWRDAKIELLIATINDANHCFELTDSVEESIVAPLTAEERENVDFGPARDELAALVRTYQDALVRRIFVDVEPAVVQLFTKEWLPPGVDPTKDVDTDADAEDDAGGAHASAAAAAARTGSSSSRKEESGLVGMILECFGSYLDDNLEPCMLAFLVKRVCAGLLDKLAARYVEELLTKHHPSEILTSQIASDLMDGDQDAIAAFFRERCGLRDSATEAPLALLHDVCSLYTADVTMLSFACHQLLSAYSDFTPKVLAIALAARSSGPRSSPGYLTKEQREDAYRACEEQQQQQQQQQKKKRRTFFSRLRFH